jgi:hypothetical protein
VVQEPDESSSHELGPIRLDPLSNQYRGSCSCGAQFGPLLNAGMVHAAFAAHRRVAVSSSDS